MLEQMVIWPVRLAPTAPGRSLYKDSALLSLAIDPGGHGSPWSTRRSIGANYADCVRCNERLTVATGVYKRRDSLVSGRQAVRQSNAHELAPQNPTGLLSATWPSWYDDDWPSLVENIIDPWPVEYPWLNLSPVLWSFLLWLTCGHQ